MSFELWLVIITVVIVKISIDLKRVKREIKAEKAKEAHSERCRINRQKLGLSW